MGRPLLIFIGSSGVGSYINAMANAVNKYDVNLIALVNVIESPSVQQMDFERFANKVLWDVLCGLVEGVFKEPRPDLSAYREIPVLEAKQCEAYKKLKEIFGSTHQLTKVTYPFLTRDIEELKNTYGPDVIIDLSGVQKRVAIDILTACLAVGISDVMLFELQKPIGGPQALYHNLKKGDFNHVVLPRWEPLINNIEFFAARQNRSKLKTALISMVVSIGLILAYQLVRVGFGEGNWFTWILVIAIAATGLFGGVTPLMDVWGGLRLVLSYGKRKKI